MVSLIGIEADAGDDTGDAVGFALDFLAQLEVRFLLGLVAEEQAVAEVFELAHRVVEHDRLAGFGVDLVLARVLDRDASADQVELGGDHALFAGDLVLDVGKEIIKSMSIQIENDVLYGANRLSFAGVRQQVS